MSDAGHGDAEDSAGAGDTTSDAERGGSESGGPESGNAERGGSQGGDAERGGFRGGDAERGGSQGGDAERGGSQGGDAERGGSQGGDAERGGSQGGDAERGDSGRGESERGDAEGGGSAGGASEGAGRGLRISAMVMCALLAAILGAVGGSWIAGRDYGPLPDDAAAVRLAQEIIPGVAPAGEIDRRDYRYGSPLGDDESGSGYVEIPYAETGFESEVKCDHDQAARAGAEAHGWTDFSRVDGYLCDNWNARRGDLVIAYTHDLGPTLTIYRSTTAAGYGALLGAGLGAIVGAATGAVLGRRRAGLVIGVVGLPLVVLLPITLLLLAALASGGGDGPYPEFWTFWPSLFRLFTHGWFS
ncbi:hypothetical protein ACTOB_005315 [Actinoplanes oblitus]|uniref:Uncharacterized protein n=1 Tax=Actinoplanes oblitus TaxID=3040509 RepID=A0ABY8W6P5_9ACTN|nr:hypothetical protein [Actinoplanes oblitus]WIM93338.1 hypothetical protein ACTOB_005315 [Actinoplanes oblitus]